MWMDELMSISGWAGFISVFPSSNLPSDVGGVIAIESCHMIDQWDAKKEVTGSEWRLI